MTAVLFDLDGTLLNTLDDLVDATNATLSHFGCPQRTWEEVRQFVGNGAERLIRLALPGKADDPDVYEVLSYYKDYYAAHSQIKTRPYAGILEALHAVRQEYPVAIVSNKPDNAVKILCAQYFGDTYALGESDTCPRKPAPDMVHKALKAIGAETCIYVGDSEVDVLTARNAGMPCLSVLWGFRDKEILVDAGATHFCENPADLLSCLKEMI
jgi:phosphoglycolate phosphatase